MVIDDSKPRISLKKKGRICFSTIFFLWTTFKLNTRPTLYQIHLYGLAAFLVVLAPSSIVV